MSCVSCHAEFSSASLKWQVLERDPENLFRMTGGRKLKVLEARLLTFNFYS